MDNVTINWLAVLGATLVCFVLGALWYGPLFGKAWMLAIGMDPAKMKDAPKPKMARLLIVTFVLEWLMSSCLAAFIGAGKGAALGTLFGFLTGLPWIAFAVAVNAMFEGRSFKYMLINGSYWTVSFTLMGLIIGWLQ
ncbi:MAG TPA: DUF1761 domain-containing protein [Candidatus Acidoferrum sp.]|nr:DUF1761 domain-containing protein [Candidatus Acidoferrum sp.]